jgi:ABC-type lipoprotein release transport system permease subunit
METLNYIKNNIYKVVYGLFSLISVNYTVDSKNYLFKDEQFVEPDSMEENTIISPHQDIFKTNMFKHHSSQIQSNNQIYYSNNSQLSYNFFQEKYNHLKFMFVFLFLILMVLGFVYWI